MILRANRKIPRISQSYTTSRLQSLASSSHIMKRSLLWTPVVGAALALSTANQVTHAFSVHPPMRVAHRPYHASSVTHLAALKNNDNDSNRGGGILDKLKDAAKAILPAKWFQSKQERSAALERSRRKQEIKSNLKEMLADAPLPVRMMGGLAANVFSSALSGMAETFQEQQETMDKLLAQAEQAIMMDDAVRNALGEPIQVSRQPFSQSSSTTSINGKTTINVQLGVSVTGSRQSGMAQLTSNDGATIQQLVVQVNGRVLPVSLTQGRTWNTGQRKAARSGKDDIIEAEIIEKETKLK